MIVLHKSPNPVERPVRLLYPLAVAVVGVSDSTRRGQAILSVIGEWVRTVVGQVARGVIDHRCRELEALLSHLFQELRGALLSYGRFRPHSSPL